MTKRIFSLTLVLLLVFSVAIASVSAFSSNLDDSADLLTDQEEAQLASTIGKLSEELECNVCFATVNDLSNPSFTFNGTALDYAERYYETKYGVNTDGVIVFLVMHDEDGDRQIFVLGTGKCQKLLSTEESADIRSDAINNHNPGSHGYYDFFDSIAKGLAVAVPPHLKWYSLPLALLIGFAVAMMITLSLKSKLKSVKPERSAANYVRSGSMQLSDSRDTFLYHTVSRTPRPKSNSSGSHTSSGGGSYSGGGSKF